MISEDRKLFYQALENKERQLLDLLASTLLVGQIKQLEEFIDANEYGIMLEWLQDFLIQNQNAVSPQVTNLMRELSEMKGTPLGEAFAR